MSWRVITNIVKHRPAAMRMADRLGRGRGRFRPFEPMARIPKPDCVPDLRNWESHDLAAIWIGHATVLLRIAGITILTDPVFSNRVGIGLGPLTGGPQRLIAPAIPLKRLPKVDLILSSHAHFDHLDRPTLYRIDKSIPVVMAHQTRDLVVDLGFTNITELRWGESTSIRNVRITAIPVVHWGARTFHDKHRGYNAYLIEGGAKRVLFGGDTAYHEGFETIAAPGKKVDLAIMGIGAYDPYVAAHATPEQAWRMAEQVRAECLLPIHHRTFRLSHEPDAEPLERLMVAAGTHSQRIVGSKIGELWVCQTTK